MPPPPLRIRDFTLTAVATGLSARNVRELLERLTEAPPESLLHHLWGRLLRPDPTPGEYGNDLAAWAGRKLRDPVLAERLALVDPVRFADTGALREHLVDVLEARVEELHDRAPDTRPGDAFHFVAHQMVIFDTGVAAEHPGHLAELVPDLPDASLFLHFVRAPGFEGAEDLGVGSWARPFGERWERLADDLDRIDVFLLSPSGLRERLIDVLSAHPVDGP